MTVSEEHKTEEHHEAQTLPSPVVNGADKAEETEDKEQNEAADEEQPTSSEAGPSTDQTDTTDEAKTKEKSGKTKGFMGFLKSKTRSQSKEREQDKDGQKPKTESEEEGSKKGDSLEREHKQFKISLFSKKTDDKKPEKDETEHPPADGDKEAEKHRTKFSLFGKKKDKPSEDTEEHKGEGKEEPLPEMTGNVDESQAKPKEKKWFHFGKKSGKDASVVEGDAHPYEEPVDDSKKDSEQPVKESEGDVEPEKQEPEKLDKEEETVKGEEVVAGGDASASLVAEVPDKPEPAAAADVETAAEVTDEKEGEEKEEPHVEEKSPDVSPGGTLTTVTDSKDSKVHKKFSFGIKFGKKQKMAKSESVEEKANKDDVAAETDTAKQDQSNEPPKDEEQAPVEVKQKKQKLFSFGKLTKSKSKDEPGLKHEKPTEDAEQKVEDITETQNKDEELKEDGQDVSDEKVPSETVDIEKTEPEAHHELTEQEQNVASGEGPSEEVITETETEKTVEEVEIEKEAEPETAEVDQGDEIKTQEVPGKDEVSEQEVKKDKKEPKKFSFGIKFGQKKEEKTDNEAPVDTTHKQKETKWSPFSKKPAKKATEEPVKVEDEANKQEDDQTAAETVEKTDEKEVATVESEKAEETKEKKEEKTINIRLPKLFSFGKKEALVEDRNIAEESKDECAEGHEATEGEAEMKTHHEEEEQADKQVESDKKEGSKVPAGIRKFFSMGRREKEDETKQEDVVAVEEKDEATKDTDAEIKSSPESKPRQRSKSPHKRFPFEIKFGKKKEKPETDVKEKEPGNVEVVQTSEGEVVKVVELQQEETVTKFEVQTDSALVSEQPKEVHEIQHTATTLDTVAVEEHIEIKASTSTQEESAPTELTVAAVASEVDSGLPEVQETTTKQEEEPADKASGETHSTPASDAGKPAARGRRFPFAFKFGRRSERAKSAERTSPAATEETGSAPVAGQPETVKRAMETSASVPDVHLRATSHDDNQLAEPDQDQAKPEETTAEDTSAKTKDSHVHLGIKWPHFGGRKSPKQDEPRDKESADGNETVESRPAADDSQLSVEDSSTPKSKKSFLGKGILRLFSPRRDLQKSLTMDADDREGVITYSVEGEGQIMAADMENWRSKTASLDSKGRIPKSSTTGADQSEMVAVIADVDSGKCEVDGPSVGSSHLVVVAIDFGTTYSGYAFSFAHDSSSTANQIHMMRRWEGGDPGVVNQKTPTTILLTPSRQFHSFGFTARDFYHDLDQVEAQNWLYFEKFKMNLHHCTVSAALLPILKSSTFYY